MNPDRSSEQALKEGQLNHMLSPLSSYNFAVGCKGSVLCLFAMDLLNAPTMYRTAAHLSTHTKMLLAVEPLISISISDVQKSLPATYFCHRQRFHFSHC